MAFFRRWTGKSEQAPASARQPVSSMPGCPYSIQLLHTNSFSSTYVIREKDEYGEFPNIYVKVYFSEPSRLPTVVVLSDSGTGLNIQNNQSLDNCGRNSSRNSHLPSSWNIATFLSSVLNPQHAAPYVVLTTHCHYDHICGIQHLLDAKVNLTVLSSSYDVGFLTPWSNLQKHSLCDLLGLQAPRYDARWIEDAQRITVTGHPFPRNRFQTSITVIHTPGHTPDSISWYDSDSCTLCVGDMFYEKESDETRSGSDGQWNREPPQPVIFTHESNIVDWNASMHRLLDYVRFLNRRMGTDTIQFAVPPKQDGLGCEVVFKEVSTPEDEWSVIDTVPSKRRVALCASHVTIGTDAELALSEMLAFMLRIQLDQVPKQKVQDSHFGHETWLWDDALASQDSDDYKTRRTQFHQFSVKAPWSIIHRTTQNHPSGCP